MHIEDADALVNEYDNTARDVREILAAVSTFVGDAYALLGTGGENPAYGPRPALQTLANELGVERDDVAWRVDFVRTTDAEPLGVSGRVEATAPLNRQDAFVHAGLTPEQAEVAEELMQAGVAFADAVQAAQSDDPWAVVEESEDAFVLPDWSDPENLTDAELYWSLQNWPGTDNDPLLDGLIDEFNNRAEPEGGWLSLGQHRVVTANFGAAAFDANAVLHPHDRIGQDLVDFLADAGFDAESAEIIAASLRAQFPGDEIALQQGLDAAIEQLAGSPDQADPLGAFRETLDSAGEEAVFDLNVDFFGAARESSEAAAFLADVELTDQALADIITFAVANGITVAAAAGHYFGVDRMAPSGDGSSDNLFHADVHEIEVRIQQEEATLEALQRLHDFDYENATIAAAIGQWAPNPEFATIHGGQADFASHDVDWAQMAAEAHGTTNLAEILELVSFVEAEGSDENLASTQAFIETLKGNQFVSYLAANELGLDPLSAEQIELLENLQTYDGALTALGGVAPAGSDSWDPAFIESWLEDPHFGHGGRRDEGTAMASPEFVALLEKLLADPQLLEILRDRESSDLFSDFASADSYALDFGRLESAPDRQLLSQILEPFSAQIDGNGDNVRTPDDYAEFAQWAIDNPAAGIPRVVIEAAQAAASEHFTDRNVIDDLHLLLDVVGTTEIPFLSQAADAVNAGLYLTVDQDYVNAGISAVGIAAVGVVALRPGRLADIGDSVINFARSGRVDPLGGLGAGLGGVRVSDEWTTIRAFGRTNRSSRLLQIPSNFRAGDVTTVTFTPLRSAPYRRLGERIDQVAFVQEYARQLKRQELVLNAMSAERFVEARRTFFANGRGSSSAAEQAAFKQDWIASESKALADANRRRREADLGRDLNREEVFQIETVAQAQVRLEADALDSLHEPDHIAGGWGAHDPTDPDVFGPAVTDVGVSGVNRSIGSSWRTRVDQIDAQAQFLIDAGNGADNLNVSLVPDNDFGVVSQGEAYSVVARLIEN